MALNWTPILSINLSYLDVFDFFFRFAAIGQLILLAIYTLNKTHNFKSLLILILIMCTSSYLLLTLQIPNHHYGYFRGVLLFFTDLIPYVLWFYTLALLKDDFHPKNWPIFIKLTLFIALCWLIYFFIYLQGKGLFHQVNHAIEVCVCIHTLYLVLRDLNDDLVNHRRKIRLFIVLAISFYVFILAGLELLKITMVHTSLFSLINSTLIFIVTNIFCFFLFRKHFTGEIESISEIVSTNIESVPQGKTIQAAYQTNLIKLNQFTQRGKFKSSNLTIKVLAQELSIPEHQLRELINQQLGFKNFSSFLNSFRIPAACTEFKNINNARKPILTIALELGYGSIGPFNRAFKESTGKTPTEYRQSCDQ